MAKLETISDTASPAPWRLAWRRTNQLPIPARGASTTRLGMGTPPSVQLSFNDRAMALHGTNQVLNLFEVLGPWAQVVLEQVPGVELFDAHTHLGQNDPDGMRQQPEELLRALRAADARGAFVFPMHEPAGYPPANDMVLAAAAESDGLLMPFCRVNPHQDAVR